MSLLEELAETGAVAIPDGSPDAPLPGPDDSPAARGVAWHYGDPFGEQTRAARGAALVDRSHRTVWSLTGRDRLTWLNTITSQKLDTLGDPAASEFLNLDGSGRALDHVQVANVDGVTYLDLDAPRAAELLAFLTLMKFRADVTIAERPDLALITLIGPGVGARAEGILALPTEVGAAAAWTDGDGAPLGFVRRTPGSIPHYDVVGPVATVAALWRQLRSAGFTPAGLWAYDAFRVADLRPKIGVDTDAKTIPHEAGWAREVPDPVRNNPVHLFKGCYRGQETVARVHNLGKPPRVLVLLHLDGSGERPESGDAVTLLGEDGDPGRAVGFVGTVVDHFEYGPIALATIKRSLPVDTRLLAGGIAAAIDADSYPKGTDEQAGRAAIAALRGGGARS